MSAIETVAVGDRGGFVSSSDGEQKSSAPGAVAATVEGLTIPTAPETSKRGIIQNMDPARRRIKNPTRGLIRKLIRFFRAKLYPELTPEQRARLSEKKARQELEKNLAADARTAERRMIKRLTDLGLCYEYKRRDGSAPQFKTVRFDKVRFEPNAIYFHVDTSALPHGVSTESLKTKEVTDNLGLAVGHAVSCKWSVEKGIWYVVERASGAMGIPNHVQLTDMWGRMPSSKDSLTIPIGLGPNSRPEFESISAMTHILIAGSTNSGKSNFMNVLLGTLIRFNTPDKLRLLLVDLKGGMEFSFYSGIPHLMPVGELAPDGIVRARDDVPAILDWLVQEGEKRMRTFTEAKAKNIAKYNAHRKNKLPRIVLVIDEWADVMYSKKKGAAEEALVNVVQRMRAVGIHVIVCTQVPKSEVLTNLVKSNLPAKFAFNTTTNHGSMAILDNAHAHRLYPAGRCIFQFQDERTVQTPFISDQMIMQIVEDAKAGVTSDINTGHDLTPEEIMNWALANNNGELPYKPLYAQFRDRGISQKEMADWIRSWEGKEFVIGTTVYRVEPDNGGNKPRRLVAIEEQPDTDQEPSQ